MNSEPNYFEKQAIKVSFVSIAGNTLLSILKLLAGLIAHSSAMVSDAVHSASDVFSSIIVIIGVKIAAKESDKDHPYGHERFECVAAIVLSVLLLVTGLFIGHVAYEQLMAGQWDTIQIPGTIALVAAIVSILAKEGMYWYTRHYAKKLDSGALMADAWHHRSDALSSVGALIGIFGARHGYPWFDSIASLVICLFIAKVAYDIFMDAIQKMVDHACSEEIEQEMLHCVEAHEKIEKVSQLSTREFGNKVYVDVEVLADGNLTLFESNQIAEEIHDDIEERFPKVKHINVFVKPIQN